MAKPTILPAKPQQHELQQRKLDQILQGVKELGQGKPINVQFSWPFDIPLMKKVDEILEVVKEIRGRLAGGSGLTEAQEQALAAKLDQSSDTLQGAVEANQPPPTP